MTMFEYVYCKSVNRYIITFLRIQEVYVDEAVDFLD